MGVHWPGRQGGASLPSISRVLAGQALWELPRTTVVLVVLGVSLFTNTVRGQKMKKARIENGVVREVLDRDPFPPFAPGLKWVECGAEVEEGYEFDGRNFSAPPPIIPKTSVPVLTVDGLA